MSESIIGIVTTIMVLMIISLISLLLIGTNSKIHNNETVLIILVFIHFCSTIVNTILSIVAVILL